MTPKEIALEILGRSGEDFDKVMAELQSELLSPHLRRDEIVLGDSQNDEMPVSAVASQEARIRQEMEIRLVYETIRKNREEKQRQNRRKEIELFTARMKAVGERILAELG